MGEDADLDCDVFLGGTCGISRWREEVFLPGLAARGIGPEGLFNPVVEDWTPACQAAEDKAKARARFLLFYIGQPGEPGHEVSAYSLVEAVMSLYDRPGRTVVVFDRTGLSGHAAKALDKGLRDLRARFPEAALFDSLPYAIDWLAARLKR